MLKKSIIAIYLGTAVFLMSFSPKDLGVKNERTEFQKPTEITWQLLGQIDFVKQKNAYYGEVMYPMINSTLKALRGKKIKVWGCIVPYDSKSYALTKNGFAQCFFCGIAGPDTMMRI